MSSSDEQLLKRFLIKFRDVLISVSIYLSELIKSVNSDSPRGLNNAFQLSMEWAILVTQRVMVIATVVSMVVSYLISAVVLFIASRNVIVGEFSIFFEVNSSSSQSRLSFKGYVEANMTLSKDAVIVTFYSSSEFQRFFGKFGTLLQQI
jgi:hypothetical protein